ncbi:MAG: 30S ribosomal protein S18 [Candidatus Margulisbacteria bacterium]|jgi:small subunit ribosomal protein S18|nr:30S ribosomal protein S18 [Candidatus Margulisiibacteriota bacterium]
MTREARKPKSGGQFKKRKKKPCVFCVDQKEIDYKDIGFVKRFMTDRGKIAPRRLSGCCALHQRMIAKAVKRARQIGLAPFVVD